MTQLSEALLAAPEPHRRPAPGASARDQSRRDPAIDLIRAACLTVVLVIHIAMAGVSVSGGEVAITNAVEDEAWFAPMTWFLQVMPLFFIIGGFAARSQWLRTHSRGGTPGQFIVSRTRRLLVPALALTVFVAATLALTGSTGVDESLLAEASFRMTQPLWFLAVYLGVTALVPRMLRLHAIAPHATLTTLIAGAALIDGLRMLSGVDALGILNYAFVWLAVQQLGFLFADWLERTGSRSADSRRTSRAPKRLPAALLVAGVSTLLALVIGFGYSPELLLDNNNPASLALVALGVAQLGVLMLLHPWLRRVASCRPAAKFSAFVNAHSMRLYLWHLPVLVAVTAALLIVGTWMPEPLTLGWFATRPAMILVVIAATAVLVPALARWEGVVERVADAAATGLRARRPSPTHATWLGIAAVATLLVFGFSPLWSGLLSCALMMASLRASEHTVTANRSGVAVDARPIRATPSAAH